MKKLIIVAAVAVVASVSMAATVAPVRVHPGNFDVNVTPQFVCLGSDDNYYPDALDWIVKLIQTKTNPTETSPIAATFDGVPSTMSYYMNTFNSEWYDIIDTVNNPSDLATEAKAIQASMKEALAHGCEIGDHTKHHETGTASALSYWYSEIDSALIDLQKVGIATDTIVGFRTPFLSYNDSTFKVLDSLHNFKYDCSIESGLDSITDGTNFVWPYTLDNGSFADDSGSLAATDKDTVVMVDGSPDTQAVRVKVGNHPGLWEAPAYCVIVPPELRHQIWLQSIDTIQVINYQHAGPNDTLVLDGSGNPVPLDTVKDSIFQTDFDTTNGKITGLDYNMWSAPSNAGLGMDSAQFFATLKYTLDQRLAGNRAPFCFGIHSNIFFCDQGDTDEHAQQYGSMSSPPRSTVASRRNAVNHFIDYALSRQAVRLTSTRNMINWCANPVPFSAPVGIVHNIMIAGKNLCVRFASGKLMISGLPAGMKTSVSLYNVSGRQIAKTAATGALSWKLNDIAAGSYLLRMTAPGFVHTSSLILE